MTVDSQPMVDFEFQGFEPGDDEQAAGVAQQVRDEGGEAEVRGEGSGFDIAFIPIILGAIALVGLVNVIKNLVDDFQVGVVIDARGDKVVTSKDKTLPRGTVLVLSKDGESARLRQPDRETLADAVGAALKAGG